MKACPPITVKYESTRMTTQITLSSDSKTLVNSTDPQTTLVPMSQTTSATISQTNSLKYQNDTIELVESCYVRFYDNYSQINQIDCLNISKFTIFLFGLLFK